MRMRKVAELVLDFELYPRNDIDSHNVRNLVDAINAGVTLPPVIIDQKSKRVVDGFHRVKAKIKACGEDAEIEVIEKRYKSDADLFLDAVRYNGSHGAKLDPCDRTRCVIVAERLGLSLDAVAGALNMPTDKLGALKADRIATHAGLSIPLKRTLRHKAGQPLTRRQVEANTRSTGMNQSMYVNQVIDLIEADLLNLEDDYLMERIKVLFELLEGILIAK